MTPLNGAIALAQMDYVAIVVGEYLKFGQVLACGGSWMVAKELLANKQFDKITELARQAVALAEKARPIGGK